MRGENIPWELAAGWEEGEAGRWISSLRQVQRVVNEAVRKQPAVLGVAELRGEGAENTVLPNTLGRALLSTLGLFGLSPKLVACM